MKKEYLNQDYLNLFKKIGKDNENDEEKEPLKLIKETDKYNKYQMIKETPISTFTKKDSINETPDLSMFKINENVNDGWNIDFQFETRINGVSLKDGDPYAPVKRKSQKDENGLNKYLQNEDLREVYRPNPVKETIQMINESKTSEDDIVSWEAFNRTNTEMLLELASIGKKKFQHVR